MRTPEFIESHSQKLFGGLADSARNLTTQVSEFAKHMAESHVTPENVHKTLGGIALTVGALTARHGNGTERLEGGACVVAGAMWLVAARSSGQSGVSLQNR